MDQNDSDLRDRVAALEKAVSDLQAQLNVPRERPEPSAEQRLRALQERSVQHQGESARRPQRPPRKAPISIPNDPEVLLKWAGIALVVFSVAFLFKYAVDEGWLTPAIRIVLGGALGIILIALGQIVYPKRDRFGQVLQGGGLAALYITFFAAFALLDVLDFQVAFGGMVVVTLVGFGLGLLQRDPPLIVIGLLGGLATPFVLYTGSSNIVGLMTYTCLLVASTTIIFMRYGWRSVLYVTVIGAWLVFAIAADTLPFDTGFRVSDRWAVQLAVGFGVLAFWCAPVIREVFLLQKPDQVATAATSSKGGSALERIFSNVVHQLIVATPLVASALSMQIWRLNDTQSGIVMGGFAVIYAIVAFVLKTDEVERIRYSHAVMAGVLLTIAIVLLIDGNALLVCLAAEVAALHTVATKLNDRLIRAGGHSLFVVLALWMWIRIVDHSTGSPALVNPSALSDLVVLALTIPAAMALRTDTHKRLYLALAYAGMLGWLYRELVTIDNGHAYVTVAWSLIGIGFLVTGLRAHVEMFRSVGLATLVLVVAKLFVVDLAELDPLWRVAVFLGIGAVFLAVGYFLPQLWKPISSKEESESTAGDDPGPDPT